MSMQPRRPGVVTFIGVILYIQAFLSAVSAVVLLAFRDNIQDFLADNGSALSDGSVTGTIIGEVVASILLLIVASGIMSGSKGMRLFVAVVEAVVMGIALYTMVTHHAGAYLYRGFFTLLVGVFVLWALYGNDRSEAFFEGTSSV